MYNSKNQHAIQIAIDWAYAKAMNGLPGMDSAFVMAQKYLNQEGTVHQQVNSLIRWQNAKAGASGFLTGIGGLVTLPIAIPANLASVLFIQIRMIAAIAYMGGHDLREEKVKTLVYLCLVGNFAKDFLQEAGIAIGTKLTSKAVLSISEKTLANINERVGFRLLATYGSKGTIKLSKIVPFVGGIIGGSIDIITTNLIGNAARKAFIPAEI